MDFICRRPHFKCILLLFEFVLPTLLSASHVGIFGNLRTAFFACYPLCRYTAPPPIFSYPFFIQRIQSSTFPLTVSFAVKFIAFISYSFYDILFPYRAGFIENNLVFYSVIFRMFMQRVARLDLQLLRDVQFIFRVTKVL